MNWNDEFETTPLSERPVQGLNFFIQPYLSDCLETQGQLAHTSDFFTIDEYGQFEREEPISELEQCPYLTPYLFEVRIAGYVEGVWMSERIGTLYGYCIETGYLLDDIKNEGTTIFAYDGYSQLLSNIRCDLMELLKHPNPEDPLFRKLFFQYPNRSEWHIGDAKSLFVISSLELEEAFQTYEVVNLVLKHLILNYFYKVREVYELTGLLYTNGFIPFDDEFGGNKPESYYHWMEQVCLESGFTRLKDKTMDYLFYSY